MKMVATVPDLVGNTPLVSLEGVLVKLEMCNPTGSVAAKRVRDRLGTVVTLLCDGGERYLSAV